MGLFDFFKSSETRAETVQKSESGQSGTAELLTARIRGAKVPDAETAMQIPAVARCVHMAAQAAASLPIKLYRRTDKGVEEVTNDPRVDMLTGETGDTMPGSYMRYRWVYDLLLNGSAYGFIEREGGVPSRIYYIPPSEVGIIRDAESVIHKNYRFTVRGRNYYPFEFLKILRCPDGYGRGRGIVKENSLMLDTAYGVYKFQKNQLAKGGAKKGFLQAKERVTQESANEVRSKWRQLYSNPDEDTVVFLNNNIDFRELSNSAVEMQLNENMRTVNSDIMRLFGSSDGMLTSETVRNTVMPVLDMMETAFDSDLLCEHEKGTMYFAFDTRELTRGDIGARYNAYALAIDKGFMTIDEVREQEDLPELGIKFINLNLANSCYNPETQQIYTLNTNKWTDFGKGDNAAEDEESPEAAAPETEAETEVWFNENHDPENGRFTSGGNSGLTNPSGNDKIKLNDNEILKKAIADGTVSTKLDKKKQGAHVKGNPMYEERIRNGEHPSYITVGKMEIQKIINQYSGTGKARIKNGQFKETILAKDKFGVYVHKHTGEEFPTSRGTIHYSKSGAHLVPSNPEGKDD